MIHHVQQHAKFRALVRRLRPLVDGASVAVETVAVGLLERLWHATIVSAYRGDIGRLDDEAIAEAIGWHGDAGAIVEVLVSAGWIDRDPEYRLVVHDWAEHAPRFVRANATRHGGFARSGSPGEVSPREASPGESPERTPPPNKTQPNTTFGSTSTVEKAKDETAPPPLPASIAAPEPATVMRFGQKIAGPKSRADVELAWGLTALAAVLGEAWLAGIAEAVLRTAPTNPWAYARRVAADGTRERPGPGADRLRRLLALVPPPPADWPPRAAKPAPRLCAAARDEEFVPL